jgi:hypothetical protein
MHDEADDELAREAERGDLRPQVNAATVLNASPARLRKVEHILLDRLFHLSRPIACAATTTAARLSDSGQFFYLIEALRRAGGAHLDDTLLVILDEFLQLTERSYDELYLWSIVELSRRDARHVEVFWPAVIALDQRYRQEPWERPTGTTLIDRPYRLCELLFYYFVIFTIHRKKKLPRLPSLGRCLGTIAPQLTPEQKHLVCETLLQMAVSHRRDVYGDAFGMLMHDPPRS